MIELIIDLLEENNRRLVYEGFQPYSDNSHAVNKKYDGSVKCKLNEPLLNFLVSWHEYIKLASKHLRNLPKNVNNGITCICTAFSTWLGNKNGIIQAVANLDYEVKSFEQFLAIPKCRTGIYSAFIVSLRCGFTITADSFRLIYKDAGYKHNINSDDHLHQFLSVDKNDPLDKLLLLRILLLSRAHVP
jgi:hypothetical protein